jgi:dimethylargininase
VTDTAAPSTRLYGAQSMTAPLHDVVVKRPGTAFGAAYDNPAHGFLHEVDLAEAQRQHDAFCQVLTDLGVRVHHLDAETMSPDLTYTFDSALVTDRGMIGLRSGKPTRQGEAAPMLEWAAGHDIPVIGRLEDGETADGGDTFWLRPDVFCIGRSLRTNMAGAAKMAELVGGDVHVFDVPYANGPAECLHLLSVISPIADDLAVVFLPQLPAGLYELLAERCVALVPVPEDEIPSQGCNILAVRPGVVVMVEGNPATQRALLDRGCEVHAFPGTEVCINGSGGPTCITRPILRG